jgi:hypothetical protein
MNTTTYRACPVYRCHAPSRTFWTLTQALEYAERAAQMFGCVYAVWACTEGRLKCVARFAALPAA